MGRDGERKDCPIVPNQIIALRHGEGEDDVLHVAASHDSVQMFPNPLYNYLRYYDNDGGQVLAVFLAQTVLAELVESGIPLSIRESITEGEVDMYERHLGRIAIAQAELVDESQVQAEMENLDQELNDLLGE